MYSVVWFVTATLAYMACAFQLSPTLSCIYRIGSLHRSSCFIDDFLYHCGMWIDVVFLCPLWSKFTGQSVKKVTLIQ